MCVSSDLKSFQLCKKKNLRYVTYELKVWHALVGNLLKLPHDQFKVILVQLVVASRSALAVELLEPLVVLVVQVVGASDAVFDRGGEANQGRGF